MTKLLQNYDKKKKNNCHKNITNVIIEVATTPGTFSSWDYLSFLLAVFNQRIYDEPSWVWGSVYEAELSIIMRTDSELQYRAYATALF